MKMRVIAIFDTEEKKNDVEVRLQAAFKEFATLQKFNLDVAKPLEGRVGVGGPIQGLPKITLPNVTS